MTVLMEKTKKTWQNGRSRPVLILNQGWQWHQVRTVEEAFTLLCPEVGEETKARILDAPDNFAQYTWDDWSKLRPRADAEWVLHGARVVYRVPEIILLTQYDRSMPNKVRFSRRQIRMRDGGICQYCGKRCEQDEWTIDHIWPASRRDALHPNGGETTWLNCVLACYKCNQRKNNRTPKEAGMKLLREPFKPKHDLLKVDFRRAPESWKLVMPKDFDKLISEAYWNCPLE